VKERGREKLPREAEWSEGVTQRDQPCCFNSGLQEYEILAIKTVVSGLLGRRGTRMAMGML
jgi:hypothetical protein